MEQPSVQSPILLDFPLAINKLANAILPFKPWKFLESGYTVNSPQGVPRIKFIEERNITMLFAPKEKGQGLVEYAIIIALVAIVVIAVMRLLGPKIGNTFSTINSSLP